MTYYDLCVPYTDNQVELQRTIAFLHERYTTLALNHTITSVLPKHLACPIPSPLPFPTPANLTLLRRCTVNLASTAQNSRLPELTRHYDLLALRPTDEKTLTQACLSLECDMISLDLTRRYPFHFRFGLLSAALQRGVKFEICYAPGVAGADGVARANLIQNATQLIRATRGGRGLVVSSEAARAAGCRGPEDVVNLCAVWGLGQERGRDSVGKLARAVVVAAGLRRTSYRGVVDVVFGGEKEGILEGKEKEKVNGKGMGVKRKAEDEVGEGAVGSAVEQPISNRERKRREKMAKKNAAKDVASATAVETA